MLTEIVKHGRFNIKSDSTWKKKKDLTKNFKITLNNCDNFVHIYSKIRNLCILIKFYKDDKLYLNLLVLLWL